MNISASAVNNTEIPSANQAPADIKPGVVPSLPGTKKVQAPTQVEKRTDDVKNAETTSKETQLTREDVEEMVEALEEMTKTLQTKLNFSINESTNDVVVRVLDKDTEEVIKQFPPEELLELQEKMQDLTGFLFNADA